MSQRFKGDEFDKENDDERESDALETGITNYKNVGNIRNLRIVKQDGTRYFFNYAYFGAVRYSPEKSYISFEAQGYTVYMKGYCLEQLYLDLYAQLTMEIKCLDPRYVDEENPKVGVTEISVVSTKQKKKKEEKRK